MLSAQSGVRLSCCALSAQICLLAVFNPLPPSPLFPPLEDLSLTYIHAMSVSNIVCTNASAFAVLAYLPFICCHVLFHQSNSFVVI